MSNQTRKLAADIKEERITDLQDRAATRAIELRSALKSVSDLSQILRMPTETVFKTYHPKDESAAWVSGAMQFLRSVNGSIECLDRIVTKEGDHLRAENLSPSIFDEVYNDLDKQVSGMAGLVTEIPKVAANLRYWLGITEPKQAEVVPPAPVFVEVTLKEDN
jgi:hypothetical protein